MCGFSPPHAWKIFFASMTYLQRMLRLSWERLGNSSIDIDWSMILWSLKTWLMRSASFSMVCCDYFFKMIELCFAARDRAHDCNLCVVWCNSLSKTVAWTWSAPQGNNQVFEYSHWFHILQEEEASTSHCRKNIPTSIKQAIAQEKTSVKRKLKVTSYSEICRDVRA